VPPTLYPKALGVGHEMRSEQRGGNRGKKMSCVLGKDKMGGSRPIFSTRCACSAMITASAHVDVTSFEIKVSIPQRGYWLWPTIGSLLQLI
jgi:hypothetical protein